MNIVYISMIPTNNTGTNNTVGVTTIKDQPILMCYV